MKDARNAVTAYTYTATGQVGTITNALGGVRSFEYDLLGRIKTVTDKKGNVTEYFCDANGNIVQTKDALGNSSYFEYDSMNRLKKVTLYRKNSRQNVNEAQITVYHYDYRGLLKKRSTQLGMRLSSITTGTATLLESWTPTVLSQNMDKTRATWSNPSTTTAAKTSCLDTTQTANLF